MARSRRRQLDYSPCDDVILTQSKILNRMGRIRSSRKIFFVRPQVVGLRALASHIAQSHFYCLRCSKLASALQMDRMGDPPVDAAQVRSVLRWRREQHGDCTATLRASESDFTEEAERWANVDSKPIYLARWTLNIFCWAAVLSPFMLKLVRLKQTGRLGGIFTAEDWTFKVGVMKYSEERLANSWHGPDRLVDVGAEVTAALEADLDQMVKVKPEEEEEERAREDEDFLQARFSDANRLSQRRTTTLRDLQLAGELRARAMERHREDNEFRTMVSIIADRRRRAC
ncbi:unnamed protein product [Symbiodinium microadriaticum]|nr:unnamed protein product [Symbiodinium microadriaticum]